jgi:hypothetical protein
MGHTSTTQDNDFEMGEVERGTGTDVSPSFSNFSTSSRDNTDNSWGVGNPNWNMEGNQADDPKNLPSGQALPSAFATATVEPTPTVSIPRTSSVPSQPRDDHPFQWQSNIFWDTVRRFSSNELRAGQCQLPFYDDHQREDRAERPPQRPQPSPDATALVRRAREAGIEIPYRYDDDLDWEFRSAMEDALFQLDKKSN